MWTNAQITVQMTMDIARWHCTASWLDDPGMEPVVLERGGTVRVHPFEDPVNVLNAALDDMTRAAAERGWEFR